MRFRMSKRTIKKAPLFFKTHNFTQQIPTLKFNQLNSSIFSVPSSDKPTLPGHLSTTTPATQEVSVDGSSPNPLKSLYKTLTTPRDNGDYTSSSSDVPAMPSISSDQFQAAPRDYVDATGVTMVQPDLLDD